MNRCLSGCFNVLARSRLGSGLLFDPVHPFIKQRPRTVSYRCLVSRLFASMAELTSYDYGNRYMGTTNVMKDADYFYSL